MISAKNNKTSNAVNYLGSIGKYSILREIEPDTHLYPVFEASYFDGDKKESKKCVIKAIPDQTVFQRELRVYQLDPHPNIITCLEFIENFTLKFGRFTDKSFNLIVFPYLENGDFFDLAKKTFLDERTLRFYVEQILSAIEYLHKNGLAHRDIKPDNVLLDDTFNPRLIDFGHTVEHSDLNGSFLFTSQFDVTTPVICPPEFRKGLGYLGTQMDMFAFGVMIFVLATGMQPFGSTKREDAFYQMIEKGQWEVYWSRVESSTQSKWRIFQGLSSELKELLQGLLCSTPSKRLSIEEVRSSKWYEKVLPRSADEVQSAMQLLKFA